MSNFLCTILIYRFGSEIQRFLALLLTLQACSKVRKPCAYSCTPTLTRLLLLLHAYSCTPTLTRLLLLLHAYSCTPAITRLLLHACLQRRGIARTRRQVYKY